MTGWYLLLLGSGYYALTCGIEVLAALGWGVIGVLGLHGWSPRITRRYEPERFRQSLFWNAVVFIFCSLFFAVAGYTISQSPHEERAPRPVFHFRQLATIGADRGTQEGVNRSGSPA